MTYRKPEVQSLGDAASAIRLVGKPGGMQFDAADGKHDFSPAYDLDE